MCVRFVDFARGSNATKKFRHPGSMIDFLKYRNTCALITRHLKNKKGKTWKIVCLSLNPYSIQYLWHTAKRYRNCVFPSQRPINNDWFNDFYTKVAPSYVPTLSEACPPLYPPLRLNYFLTNSIAILELKYAISSRRSSSPVLIIFLR